jgi:hypothetical protein
MAPTNITFHAGPPVPLRYVYRYELRLVLLVTYPNLVDMATARTRLNMQLV